MKARVLGTFATIAVAALVAGSASAAPLGVLTVDNCDGGGVVVTATLIDWLPAGGGTGCITTGTGTNVSHFGGVVGPGSIGAIKDLNALTTVFPLADFMTFGLTNVHFDLTSLGPGPLSTACAAVLDPNLPACSVFAGSPFVLSPNATGTAVTLSARGIARDGSPGTSTWVGAYTTQIAGRTPAQIQANINAGGSERSTYSGEFTLSVNVIPEPTSMVLLGTGLLGASLMRRRNGKK